jgi:hypothetical protein
MKRLLTVLALVAAATTAYAATEAASAEALCIPAAVQQVLSSPLA